MCAQQVVYYFRALLRLKHFISGLELSSGFTKASPEIDMKEFSDADDDKHARNTKKPRKNHSQLGPDFVAPDGGFGWFICFAAGFSNVRQK